MELKEEKYTLAIFEDNPIVVQGLSSFFESHSVYPISVVFSSSEPSEFISQAKKLDPDFLIIDVISEKVLGLEVFENIFKQEPESIVFAYSNIKSKRIISTLVTMGVAGFVSKTDPLDSFNKAFDSLLKEKKTYLPEEHKDISRKKVFPITLTKTEKKIIPFLIKGYSTKDIASEFFITSNAVDFHKKNLFSKFQVNNIASFVKEAIAQGYSGGIHH